MVCQVDDERKDRWGFGKWMIKEKVGMGAFT